MELLQHVDKRQMDVTDAFGKTALMWASETGYA